MKIRRRKFITSTIAFSTSFQMWPTLANANLEDVCKRSFHRYPRVVNRVCVHVDHIKETLRYAVKFELWHRDCIVKKNTNEPVSEPPLPNFLTEKDDFLKEAEKFLKQKIDVLVVGPDLLRQPKQPTSNDIGEMSFFASEVREAIQVINVLDDLADDYARTAVASQTTHNNLLELARIAPVSSMTSWTAGGEMANGLYFKILPLTRKIPGFFRRLGAAQKMVNLSERNKIIELVSNAKELLNRGIANLDGFLEAVDAERADAQKNLNVLNEQSQVVRDGIEGSEKEISALNSQISSARDRLQRQNRALNDARQKRDRNKAGYDGKHADVDAGKFDCGGNCVHTNPYRNSGSCNTICNREISVKYRTETDDYFAAYTSWKLTAERSLRRVNGTRSNIYRLSAERDRKLSIVEELTGEIPKLQEAAHKNLQNLLPNENESAALLERAKLETALRAIEMVELQ